MASTCIFSDCAFSIGKIFSRWRRLSSVIARMASSSVMLRTIQGIFTNPASSLACWRRWLLPCPLSWRSFRPCLGTFCLEVGPGACPWPPCQPWPGGHGGPPSLPVRRAPLFLPWACGPACPWAYGRVFHECDVVFLLLFHR